MQKYANFVELEKCCQTHIFLQKFVLIQPRTSPPKICKIFENAFSKNAFSKNAYLGVHVLLLLADLAADVREDVLQVHEVHRVEVDARLLLIGVGPMSNYEMERPSYHLFELFKLSPSMTAEIGPFTRPTFFIKKLCVPYF